MIPLEPNPATIIFGACDRHNLGDLLFPHIVTALLPRQPCCYAGVAARDLRGYGGHDVAAIARLAAARGGEAVTLIHAGGELLTCTLWQAALMVQPPAEAKRLTTRLEGRPELQRRWAQRALRLVQEAPYTLDPSLFPRARRVIYNGVGGVELDRCEVAMRDEVVAKLRTADSVTVRDRTTQGQLAQAGISAGLLPDSAVMVAELFGGRIAAACRQGEVARLLADLPHGYVAVQFSAEFGDDATLASMAAQLDGICAATGCGIVLFRAGAAPWHDDLECYRRLAARMRTAAVRISTGLDIWTICAVIARSRAYCGSSLHGRIVALAHGLPRLNIAAPGCGAGISKQQAWAATWEPGVPAVVAVERMAEALEQLLRHHDGEGQRHLAAQLAQRCRDGFGASMQ